MIVKNVVELGNASARSAVVQAKSKTSGRIQEDEIFPVQRLTVDRGRLWADLENGSREHTLANAEPCTRSGPAEHHPLTRTA